MAGDSDGIIFGLQTERAWMIPGGEEDDDSVTLHIIVRTDPAGVRYFDVKVPIQVADDFGLDVGEPSVTEVSG